MDCDRALTVCKDSRRALYRKALCLKELGKYKEAYNCTTECLHVSCQVQDGGKLMPPERLLDGPECEFTYRQWL